MTAVVIRQSGSTNIISIPIIIMKTLNLHIGSKLDLSIEDNKIVLTPIAEKLMLESLLAGRPKECFTVTDEDRGWIDANYETQPCVCDLSQDV
ncbi:AbrB/MazE/SpoVT family DNA-binding domain-containing protein [Xenorhabdus sp. XENO-10]|uniref:AbrB/MazE/SpoVT family DNA-binding domain-containing protein n=1 Tax=Xenorhabdus yunnanensis TaxID=3025878 RepID=A0ABT5LDW4_9GAMM|nr:AbrB/MazE/SpoVT family DNA-binding domain-containing protein [Xenorhabdus yunnanensis]MDC9589302.1 AbrB/MazE/SpoVT family DNA-binding domain-containing protein [Xenorhabdus yunnanensis]